jgi:prevent-host-death family protein
MFLTITVDEAQAKLKDLIHQLAAGDEIIITENAKPVAKLVSEPPTPPPKQRPGPGLCKGMITVVSDDDEHLKDFEEYMP